MIKQKENTIKPYKIDFIMFFLFIFLILFGLVMVLSSSITMADRQYGLPFYYFNKQLLAVALGLFSAIIVFLIPINFWDQYSKIILFGSITLLIIVLIPGIGKVVNGSSRWIPMGIFNFQVSELAKLGFIIYLSSYLDRKKALIQTSLQIFVIPLLSLSVIALLLLAEPDMGSTVIIAMVTLGLLFIAGIPLINFIIVTISLLFVGIALIIFEPYRFERLLSFTNPWLDPFDKGYQLTQSLMAISRGGWFGMGLGNSIQKQFYLPEAHTDFIFAIIAEELGVIGAVSVISLFVLLLYRIFMLAHQQMQNQKFFEAYLLFGLALWIGGQGFINIGVNIGILPTKGLTLPFISYGGSSMVVMIVVIGLIFRINYESVCKP